MVPVDVQQLIGRKEIWRSLRTDSAKIALRRLPLIVATIEAEIEQARLIGGLPTDATLLQTLSKPSVDDLDAGSSTVPKSDGSNKNENAGGLTLGEAYALYIDDPTRSWSPSTREAYETCRKLVISVMGEETRMSMIARSHCRDFLEVLRFLPHSATKRFPRLSPREASKRARQCSDIRIISAANANSLMSNLSSFLNWAVNEELADRNPARGLRLPDPVAKRDKRLPFSNEQLRLIFDAPLYMGCVDGDRGYNKAGSERPRNARFWIPLIALFTGARLGELCQLDVADIREESGIHFIAVSERSLVGSEDKSLKTVASERRIPIHRILLQLGILAFVEKKRRAGGTKLFDDIEAGSTESRTIAFSKWFTQFIRATSAQKPRTSFHSFRHNFRDELRAADINHDIAMLLGGWTTGGSSRHSVSENYGSGFRIEALHDAMNKLSFNNVNVSHLALDAR